MLSIVTAITGLLKLVQPLNQHTSNDSKALVSRDLQWSVTRLPAPIPGVITAVMHSLLSERAGSKACSRSHLLTMAYREEVDLVGVWVDGGPHGEP